MSQELLNTVPDVIIDVSGGSKFIVAEIMIGEIKKLVVRARRGCRYHSDIEDKLRTEVRTIGAMAWCVGGGKYKIDEIKKTIFIWSESGEFGKEPNREQTIEMLKNAFQEYLIVALTNMSALEMNFEL